MTEEKHPWSYLKSVTELGCEGQAFLIPQHNFLTILLYCQWVLETERRKRVMLNSESLGKPLRVLVSPLQSEDVTLVWFLKA
jgi:hypothetical protein